MNNNIFNGIKSKITREIIKIKWHMPFSKLTAAAAIA